MVNKTIVGIQSSSVKKYLTTYEDVKKSFKKFNDIGFKYMQLQWVDNSVSSQEIKKALEKTNITAVSVQDYYSEFVKNEEYYIDLCKTLRCEDLTVSGVPVELMSESGCLEYSKILQALSDKLKTLGITLSFHPRNHEFRPINTISATDIIMLNTDLLLCLDGFHCYTAGIDPASMIEKYSKRISSVHFKDYKGDNIENLCPIGQGEIDWSKTFEACSKFGIKYCYVEQERWSNEPFHALKESFDYLISKKGFENY